jgi:hypothetical protein
VHKFAKINHVSVNADDLLIERHLVDECFLGDEFAVAVLQLAESESLSVPIADQVARAEIAAFGNRGFMASQLSFYYHDALFHVLNLELLELAVFKLRVAAVLVC